MSTSEKRSIVCPSCTKNVEVTPDDEGQVSCPECGGYYPVGFATFEARRLANIEKRRRAREGTRGEADPRVCDGCGRFNEECSCG